MGSLRAAGARLPDTLQKVLEFGLASKGFERAIVVQRHQNILVALVGAFQILKALLFTPETRVGLRDQEASPRPPGNRRAVGRGSLLAGLFATRSVPNSTYQAYNVCEEWI